MIEASAPPRKRQTRLLSERIALVAPDAASVARLRDDLLLTLAHRGHRVLCITPEGRGRDAVAIRDLRAQLKHLDFGGIGPALITDWRIVSGLSEMFKDWDPNIVLGFGLTPMICAATAAKRAGVRRVVSFINDLSGGVEKAGIRRFSYAMQVSDAVVFHNRDDFYDLDARGVLKPDVPCIFVPGSGVNLQRFPLVPLPPMDGGLVFLMLGRLETSRGVEDFAKAAAEVKARSPGSRFLLAGPMGRGRGAVALESISALSRGAVRYLGDLDDVRPELAACHVLVYPSFGEGMPRAVQEALATGRPVITTSVRGCRETVDEKVSGCLVQPGDAAGLARAMEGFLKRPDLIATMSRAARLKAERRFDAFETTRRIIEEALDL